MNRIQHTASFYREPRILGYFTIQLGLKFVQAIGILFHTLTPFFIIHHTFRLASILVLLLLCLSKRFQAQNTERGSFELRKAGIGTSTAGLNITEQGFVPSLRNRPQIVSTNPACPMRYAENMKTAFPQED